MSSECKQITYGAHTEGKKREKGTAVSNTLLCSSVVYQRLTAHTLATITSKCSFCFDAFGCVMCCISLPT